MGSVADEILELQRAFDNAEMRGDADRLVTWTMPCAL
jgi:hypothetical protein